MLLQLIIIMLVVFSLSVIFITHVYQIFIYLFIYFTIYLIIDLYLLAYMLLIIHVQLQTYAVTIYIIIAHD